jgi:cytochrome P450
MAHWLYVFVAIALFLSWIQLPRNPIRKGVRKVPGPKGLPLVGNVLQLGTRPQRQYEKWADQYGELFLVKLGFFNWVFVNTPAAVKEIFDKRSAITSARPPMPVASSVVSDDKRILLLGYTAKWRKLRTIAHKLLTPKISMRFKPSQDFEAKQMVHDILRDSADQESFYMHVRRYTTSVIMTSTYGKRVPNWVSSDSRFHKISFSMRVYLLMLGLR